MVVYRRLPMITSDWLRAGQIAAALLSGAASAYFACRLFLLTRSLQAWTVRQAQPTPVFLKARLSKKPKQLLDIHLVLGNSGAAPLTVLDAVVTHSVRGETAAEAHLQVLDRNKAVGAYGVASFDFSPSALRPADEDLWPERLDLSVVFFSGGQRQKATWASLGCSQLEEATTVVQLWSKGAPNVEPF
jgi:hypothetical protein